MSLLDAHISGRALFFHTMGEQPHEVRSQFKPVPPGLSRSQAASIVVEGGNHSGGIRSRLRVVSHQAARPARLSAMSPASGTLKRMP